MAILLTIVGISTLIILHEFGHYGLARAFDMRVLRFSLGFGPTLFKRKFGETTWQVAAIPLGGYVLIDGMGPDEEAYGEARPGDPRCYRNKPAWQRALVIFAGPAANWLITAAILIGLGMTTGFVQYDEKESRLGELTAEGPAATAGLHQGDKILSIGGVAVHDWPSIVHEVRAHPEAATDFEIEREPGIPLHLTVTPKRGAGDIGVIEALPFAHIEKPGPAGAITAGIKGAWRLTTEQAKMLAQAFTGGGGAQLSGLPGIVKTVSKQAERSLPRLFESLAWLSIGLFLLNLAPIPALDGSRLFFLGVEVIRRRPVDERIEGLIHTAGFVLLLGLMVFVSVRDLLYR